MKKKHIIIIGIGIILSGLIIFAIYQHKKTKEKQVIEKTFEFPKTISVNNTTEFKIDTMLMVVTNKMFKYDTINIDVFYITTKLISNEFIIHAHIIKHYFMPHSYILYLNKNLNRTQIHEVVMHELIHLDQYESGDLIISEDGKFFIYKGKKIKMNSVSYYNRPYEKEAFANTQRLLNEYYSIIKK
ncbi:MAG: hypothetical protein ACOCVF_00245 [bacterium]